MIIDENNCTYRDEHSAPFSFKTKSQRDLTIFSSPQESNKKKSSRTRNVRPAFIKRIDIPVESVEEEDIQVKSANSPGSLPKTGLDFLDNW
ncbi:hypothetical protein HHI36_006636 [Cryptolaemus montrouzieri]|uniref:DUF4706 domain-containing protein n=1 Tax=Cryptolaemus montrouzieri TaxID=559131 RepID=A0ABD2NYQ3_9CUCU